MAAVALDDEQPALDELSEVGARGRRRHPGLPGEHRRRQRAAVAEREQYPCASGIGDKGADASDIGISAHALTVAQRLFAARRIINVVTRRWAAGALRARLERLPGFALAISGRPQPIDQPLGEGVGGDRPAD